MECLLKFLSSNLDQHHRNVIQNRNPWYCNPVQFRPHSYSWSNSMYLLWRECTRCRFAVPPVANAETHTLHRPSRERQTETLHFHSTQISSCLVAILCVTSNKFEHATVYPLPKPKDSKTGVTLIGNIDMLKDITHHSYSIFLLHARWHRY